MTIAKIQLSLGGVNAVWKETTLRTWLSSKNPDPDQMEKFNFF